MKKNEIKLEEKDKLLLTAEIIICVLDIVMLFLIIFLVDFIDMKEIYKILLIIIGVIVFLVLMLFALKLEQIAGFYECRKCHSKYVPTYKQVFLAMHIGRTRYMKCPKCSKYSWNKKVMFR